MQDQHRFNTKAWLLWTAGFVAFIIGGALATGVTGRINDFRSALIGGLVGAGLAGGVTVHWSSVVDKVVIPMFLSPVVGGAGAFLLMIVPLIVFFALQRYFVQGLLAGSVK